MSHVTRITLPGATHPIEPMSVVLLDPVSGLPFQFGGAGWTPEQLEQAGFLRGVAHSAGLTVSVGAFTVDNFEFSGGTLALVPNGTWYVGVELSSKQVRALPRLGHRGWVPLAKVVTDATTVTSVTQITPVLPPCRIPRTMAKVLAGRPINVVIMGSSLTQSDGGSDRWPGMVFGAGTSAKYKVPVTTNTTYAGVGAAPNQYQLAQLGFASSHTAYGYSQSGFSAALTQTKQPPNGRSGLFSGVDLVVLGCLANGGDYRLETIEPLVRKLRQAGVEVILATDNSQGPSTAYSTLATSALYVDGPEVMRVADLYGVELADTAAYVFEAHLRAGGTGIFSDTIHMASGTPAGPSAVLPANGHESWARAVRSVFHVGVTPATSTVYNYAYAFDSTTEGWVSYSAATVTQAGGQLVVTKNTSAVSQWGAWITLPVTLVKGDTILVTSRVVYSGGGPLWGTQNGGWASNAASVPASGVSGQALLTMTKTTNQLLLFPNSDSAALNTTITLDDVTLVVTINGSETAYTVAGGRAVEIKPLPPVRVVTDMKTPADTYVILPKDELFTTSNNPNKGALGAHPWGASSFARRWGTFYGSTSDLLTLGVGKKACISGVAPVGFALIHYREAADGACTFTLAVNGSVVKAINVGVVPFGNEWFLPMLTPTEFNASTYADGRDSYEITVTSGTLKVAAFVALTADVSYVPPEEITFTGNWLPKENSRSGLPGRPTDTLDATASVRCTGRRVAWVVSSNPGSRNVDVYSDRELTAGVNLNGQYHIKTPGGLVGPGAVHTIRCAVANPAGTQADGHALHVGGAVIINDR